MDYIIFISDNFHDILSKIQAGKKQDTNMTSLHHLFIYLYISEEYSEILLNMYDGQSFFNVFGWFVLNVITLLLLFFLEFD